MTEYANHLPGQLSGGQQQRVAIARALVGNNDLIVMDEPITNLDANLRDQMLYEIREIQKNIGTTILYITHDQHSALLLCDKIAIMQKDGTLSQIGSGEDIIRRPANRFTFEFIGVSNFLPLVRKDDRVYLDTGKEDILWEEELPENLKDEVEIEMGVRPNDIIFDNTSSIRCIIKSCVFLGSEYDYFVMLGEKEIRVQQNALDAGKFGIFKEGSEVGIRFVNLQYYKKKGGAIDEKVEL